MTAVVSPSRQTAASVGAAAADVHASKAADEEFTHGFYGKVDSSSAKITLNDCTSDYHAQIASLLQEVDEVIN